MDRCARLGGRWTGFVVGLCEEGVRVVRGWLNGGRCAGRGRGRQNFLTGENCMHSKKVSETNPSARGEARRPRKFFDWRKLYARGKSFEEKKIAQAIKLLGLSGWAKSSNQKFAICSSLLKISEIR